jgi:hypothetical protein
MFRRTKPKTRPAEVIAAEKAKKTALAKTCQCCGRQIFAETGLIAHHGYQRPGWGYQTPSCMGAKHLPFEVDREQLGKMIRMMVRHRADFATHRAQVEVEKLPLPYAYNVRKAGKYEKMHLGLTRENFAEHQKTLQRAAYEFGGFDEIKSTYLGRCDRQLKGMDEDIQAQEVRFRGWKQTHKFESGEWVAI